MDAAAIYRECFVWDDHSGFELNPDAPLGSLLEPWREAGVGYLSINVAYDPRPWHQAIETIAAVGRRLPLVASYSRLGSSVGEIDQAQAEGKISNQDCHTE